MNEKEANHPARPVDRTTNWCSHGGWFTLALYYVMECAGCRQLCSDSVIQINQIMCGNDFKKRIDHCNILHFCLNSCQGHFHKWSILLVVVLATFSHGKFLYQGFGCKVIGRSSSMFVFKLLQKEVVFEVKQVWILSIQRRGSCCN